MFSCEIVILRKILVRKGKNLVLRRGKLAKNGFFHILSTGGKMMRNPVLLKK